MGRVKSSRAGTDRSVNLTRYPSVPPIRRDLPRLYVDPGRSSFASGFVSRDDFVSTFSEHDRCLVAIHAAVERSGFPLEQSI